MKARVNAASLVSVNISSRKGERKRPVDSVNLLPEHGIDGDGHAGRWHRQISLLAVESIDKMRRAGVDVGPGDFAENLTTRGIDLPALPVGTRMWVGRSLLEVTQIGKRCHDRCEIFRQAGDCVMPREGIFVRVLEGAVLRAGDPIEVLEASSAAEAEPRTGAVTDSRGGDTS
jgi:MOSC domain-containing protein YiiM